MRHQKRGRKLNLSVAHKLSMMRNLTCSLIRHGRVRTTVTRGKELQRFVEPLVTLAKEDTLHHRRRVARHVHDKQALQSLFGELGPELKETPGGYTRLIKLGNRTGDGAPVCFVEFVTHTPNLEAH
ncbi:MAG TPA: 50S ribosomal protein L17 [bacterium]|nr:50S ribosomal protein L17 [bacterium]HPO09683.1 50S ribosomal protein L17 [bacterium]HQO33836.1 50S ribosomal protein L17 [bacterium]